MVGNTFSSRIVKIILSRSLIFIIICSMMNIQSERQRRRRVKCESMKFSMICMVFLMLVCQVQYICAYERYPYEYYYPENDFIEEEEPVGNDGNSLADYWKLMKETFLKSYKDLNKPYVIEREVPVYVPVDRVRTVVKHHLVFKKPDRIIIRRWPHYQQNNN